MKDYKKILEGVVNIISTTEKSDIGFANICSYIGDNCPELAESEDERIRKELHIYLDWLDGRKDYAPRGEFTIRDMIAWLEKQGENPQGKSALEAAKEAMYDNANKVESKFHEGDWVIDNNGKVAIIYDLQNAGYVGHYTNGTDFVCKYDNEHLLHLWSINDAKDGDVLASGHLVFIFKVIHGVWLNCHCSAHNDGSFFADSYDLMTNKYFSEVHPATKEQRDLLFAKMKEAGYEWDAEKKELKKIEPNLSNSPEIGKNDTLLDLLHKMPSCITVNGINYHFVMKKTIAYMAFYEGEGEGSGKVIFWMTGDPIELLTAMLEKLKEKGLLE